MARKVGWPPWRKGGALWITGYFGILGSLFFSRQTLLQRRLALEPSVSEDDLELIILSPPLSWCWEYGSLALHPVLLVPRAEPGVSCALCKHSVDGIAAASSRCC